MTWQRLESSTVDPSLTEGLEARTADPLWLMARQWQAGEYRGEDAADPLLVRVVSDSRPLARVRLGDGPMLDATSLGAPLEAAVEAEPIRAGRAGSRVSAELGQALLDALRRTGAGRRAAAELGRRYPVTPPADDGLDPAGHRRLDLLARRSIDGVALAAAMGADPDLLARIVAAAGLAGAAAAAVTAAIDAWARRCATLFVEPSAGPAWDQRRLEYRFDVATEGAATELTAHEYIGAELRWYHFDLGADEPDAEITRKEITVLPVPLRYPGMPASRFWEFEENDVFLGGIEAGPADLARVAVATYATSFGNDWYLVPLQLPVGTIARVARVQVIDDFGAHTTVRSTAEVDGPGRTFRFFELSGDAGPERGVAPLLVTLPSLDISAAPRPLEEVRFVRDEMANLAWAVERRIESRTGRPVDLAARTPPSADGSAPQPDERWRFVLSTGAPDNWVPLVPVRLGQGRAVMLQRGRTPLAGGAATRGARGVILEPGRRFLLHEEEIPREGLRVIRRFQSARTADGRLFTWVGRAKGPGRGEGNSGLTFDRLQT